MSHRGPSEFLFGVRNGRLPAVERKRRERIAKAHGVAFVYTCLPGEGYRSWFAGPNRGDPFDWNLARAVAADLEASTPLRYSAVGSVRGSCGHEHHTPAAAQRCAMRDARGIARANSSGSLTAAYSDRVVVRSDGEPLTRDEEAEIVAAAREEQDQ